VRFRMWLFALLTLGSVCYMCYGCTLTSTVVSNAMRAPTATLDSLGTTDAKTIWNSMAVVGGSLSVVVYLCTGIPLMIGFGVLAWRNAIATRKAIFLQQETQALEAEAWDSAGEVPEGY
jgi:hypothetical protein